MAKKVGGIENLRFTRADMKNRLYTKRSLKVLEGDTGGVLEYIKKKVSKDVDFFFYQVDEDDSRPMTTGDPLLWGYLRFCHSNG